MEGIVYNVGGMFNISRESKKNINILKIQISNALADKETSMFDIQTVLRTDLENLMDQINSNTNKTTTSASISGENKHLIVKSNIYSLDIDGQHKITSDEIYNIIFK